MKKLFCCIISFFFISIDISQNIFLEKFNHLPTYTNNEITGIKGDWLLGNTQATAAVFKITRIIKIPLYYTGITGNSKICEKEGAKKHINWMKIKISCYGQPYPKMDITGI
ncbi:MAG TPA: hypothetical protein VIJ95_02575 [Hanamia sp.]